MEIQTPDFLLSSPKWRAEFFINKIVQNLGDLDDYVADAITGVDVHSTEGTTLQATFDSYWDNGDPIDAFDTSSDRIGYAIAQWQDAWRTEFGEEELFFHVHAWSLPSAEDGGASLANAGLSILAMHTYSQQGIASAAAFTLHDPEAFYHNQFWNDFGDYLRAGGQSFKMMADSIVGLSALNIEDGLSPSEEAEADYLFRAFGDQSNLVLYVINMTDGDLVDLQLDFGAILGSFDGYAAGSGGEAGIVAFAGEQLVSTGSLPPTDRNVETEINALDPNTFVGTDSHIQLELGAYEIAEITVRIGLFGSEGTDTIRGGADDDHIFGLGGDDLLVGQDGDDVLVGGAGA
ncbi:hypothetical protein DZD18_16025, partial [Rhodobacteraceae bacterium W635]